jgi:hypothetical protein
VGWMGGEAEAGHGEIGPASSLNCSADTSGKQKVICLTYCCSAHACWACWVARRWEKTAGPSRAHHTAAACARRLILITLQRKTARERAHWPASLTFYETTLFPSANPIVSQLGEQSA